MKKAATSDSELREAEALLFCEIKVVDPETGVASSKLVETPLYRAYLDYQTAYNEARAKYGVACQEAQRTAAGRNTWPVVGMALQLPVRQAYDRWRAAGADKVERALAILRDARTTG